MATAASEIKNEKAVGAEPSTVRLRGFSSLRGSFFVLVVASLMMNLLALAMPLALLQMYDRIIPNQSYSTLGLLVFGVVVAVLLETMLRVLRGYVTGWVGSRFEHRASMEGLKHLMGTPFREFTSVESGIHYERLRSAGQVKDFASGQTILVLLDLPFVVIYLTVIGLIAGWLALVVLAMLILFLAISLAVGRKLKGRIEDRIMQDDRRYSFLSETFHGIHSVKTMAMETLMHRRYERLQETNVDKGATVTHDSTVAANMGAVFTQIITVGVVAAGSFIVVQGDMTPGSLAACVMLSIRALQPLRNSLSVWMRYQTFAISRQRLKALFALPSMSSSVFGKCPKIQGGIELNNVKIHFPGVAAPLFENLNLAVSPGECISIVGDSGCGKTSLISVFNGILAPDEGTVLIDGVPVKEIDPRVLHASVAYLPQQGTVVTGTILENVTMFDDSLADAAIKASELVGLDRVVAGMRMGYETPIGEGAVDSMPAGVIQRIAIARAIVHGPRIILFDEANIAIDGAGDNLLRKYLESMKGKCTIILVTLRPTLIRLSDRVFTIKGGKLEETDLDSLDLWGNNSEAKAEVSLTPPHLHEWELADALSHFPSTSDFSLCLPTMLAALNWHGSPRQLTESLPHLVESLDLSGFRSIMANLDFQGSSYQAAPDNIDGRLLPCLFIPESTGAKVILSRDGKNSFTYFDSDSVAVVTGALPAERGNAYIFKKVEHSEAPKAGESESWTSRIFRRFKAFIAFVMGLTILSTVLTLATPMFVMGTFDLVLPTGNFEMQGFLVLGVAIALTLDWVMRSLKSRVLSFMAGRSEYIIGNSIFQRVIGLPSQSVERVSVAEQVARIKDLESLRDFFLGPLSLLIYDLPATLIYVVVLAVIYPWILLVILASAAAYAFLGALTFSSQGRRTTAAMRLISRRNEFLMETLDNLQIIRISGAHGRWLERFRLLSGEAILTELRSQQFAERVSAAAQFIASVSGLAAMTVVVIAAMNGIITGGSVVATMIIMWRVTGPLQSAFMAASTLVRMLNSLNQIDNLMRLKGERDESTKQTVRPLVHGEVSFSRVSFRYSMSADPALLGVTFTIKPGEIVALAGPNGSGKSTLLKLMVHAYHPQAGSIRLDSVDIRQLTPEDLRKQISYMPQHCDIFYGTIAQNLRLVHPIATDDDLRWAAKMSGLLDDVLALEQGSGKWKRSGFDVRIGDAGSDKLPNGFRQRLALCRTFLKQAPVMLLDEPGNGLDADGDRAFVNALEQIRGRSTIFLVSHRPSHLKLADKVIYMEQGAIQAMGPFESIKETVMEGLR